MSRIAYLLLILPAVLSFRKQLRFSDRFFFGAATSAYQVEGAWNEDGKGESMLDYFLHTFPEKTLDKSNGDVAADSYHNIPQDLKMLKHLGVDVYRFSLSWARILPTGFVNEINQKGLDYYNTLIDTLLEHNIKPIITLYQWDMPLNLHQLGGWTNPEMQDYFANFSRICFQNFGDRVKTWITISDPSSICRLGYELGILAPYYTVSGIGNYKCAHNVLLAHGKTYRIYEQEFKTTQRGLVGIALDSTWFQPYKPDYKPAFVEESERMMAFYFDWFAHPIFSDKGDYPPVMRERIDANSNAQCFPFSRLPTFTKEEVEMLKGSSDFIGVNQYNTAYVRPFNDTCPLNPPSQANDVCVDFFFDPAWEYTVRGPSRLVPEGIRSFLYWLKCRYGNKQVIITENGAVGFANEGCNDEFRLKFLTEYLRSLQEAIYIDGCNVVGYIYYSLMDGFELVEGYTARSGLYLVDFTSPNRTRTPKRSANAYKKIIASRVVKLLKEPHY